MFDIDLIAFAKNNFPVLVSPIVSIACSVISTIFFRPKIKTQARIQELEKIKAGRLEEAADMLLQNGVITYKELSKMKNYAEIARKADQFRKEHNAELPQQNFAWHCRFFEDCGDIYDDELQNIWAQILADEIYHPQSYSLRTLECVRNLSKEEAELFQRVCGHCVEIRNRVMIPNFPSFIDGEHVKFDDILRLDDCGIIKSDLVEYTLPIDEQRETPLSFDDEWMLYAKRKSETCLLKLQVYIFTASGRELFSAIVHSKNIPEISGFFNREMNDFEFGAAKAKKIDGKTVSYHAV